MVYARNFEKVNHHEVITNKIVALLEKGVRPWMQPWTSTYAGSPTRPLRHEGTPYSGMNVFILWIASEERGYSAPYWMTYKQAETYGAHVRKGEKGTAIIKAGVVSKTETNNKGEDVERTVPYMRSYTVFNVEQIDDLPEKFRGKIVENPLTVEQRVNRAEIFFANTKADIRHGGDRAFYSPHLDFIQMPDFEKFTDALSYYTTRGHESIHWTKHKSRLDRDMGKKSWGDEGYAMEELVAELGAAYLAADLGLSFEPREDHVSYLANWLKVLKNDSRAIFAAASQAERAVKFLNKLQPGTISDTHKEDSSEEED